MLHFPRFPFPAFPSNPLLPLPLHSSRTRSLHTPRARAHVLRHLTLRAPPQEHRIPYKRFPRAWQAHRAGSRAAARTRDPPSARTRVHPVRSPSDHVLLCSHDPCCAHLLRQDLPHSPHCSIPSLSIQIRHSYTHCPCNAGAARRAHHASHITVPQVSSMITANSDIRDNALTCTFNILLY